MKKLTLILALLVALTSQAWAAHYERDDAGRTVAIPDHVHRVVSLSPSLTNTVYALGAESDLVGITNYTIYPAQAVREKPSVGAVVNPSLEKIVALHPDLVLALPEFNGSATIEGLQRLNVPVFLFNTGNLSNIYRTITLVGRVMGRDQQASMLITQLHEREAKVRAQTTNHKPLTVLLVLSIDPLITAGRNAFITEMISAAGGRSVTDDLSQDWLQMNVETILPRKPDYIILMKDGPVDFKEMQRRAGWSSLDAVRLGHVIVADDRIQIPSPVAFDGLEELARQIHAAQSR